MSKHHVPVNSRNFRCLAGSECGAEKQGPGRPVGDEQTLVAEAPVHLLIDFCLFLPISTFLTFLVAFPNEKRSSGGKKVFGPVCFVGQVKDYVRGLDARKSSQRDLKFV